MSEESVGTDSPGVCYVVSYDHGGLVLWGYEHFLQHFRDLRGWLNRHPRLEMGLDNEAWMYDWLAENQPTVLEEIRQALAQYAGRLGIGTCTYGQPLAASLLEESSIRQIAYGLETVRERLGCEVSVYSWSEHAAFAQLPQVLAGFGLRGVLMRTHFLMYGFCPGYDAPIVGWEGPDGSRVACVPTYPRQERQVPSHRAHPPGPFGLTTEDTWILTRYPSADSPEPLDHFRARFAHIRPLLASRIDDSGLKREALVVELDDREEYRWATLEDVFDEFPEPAVTVRPSSEEFGTRMPWGYRGSELFDLTRRAETTLLTAERLAARRAADDGALPLDTVRGWEEELRQAWKDLLVAQHHDVQIVARAGAFGRERLHASLDRSRRLLRALLGAQAGAGPAAPGPFIAFNPLPWPRTEATAELPDGALLRGPVTVPSLGIAPFGSPALPEAEAVDLSFETAVYRVEFDPAGGLRRLETRDGRPVLREGARSGRLAGVIEGAACEGAGSVSATVDAAGYQVTGTGKVGPLPYTLRWLFPHEGTRIETRIAVRFDGERIGAPTDRKNDSRSCFLHEQKLRLRLYPAVEPSAAFGLYHVPFGDATTTRPYVEGGYWTALADHAGGLAIANRGTMGSVREEDGAFSVPLAFSTSYVWGSELICGLREWALALLPFSGDWRAAALHRRALEFAFPLVAVPGRMSEARPDYLRLDNPNLHLTAFYTEGSHTYLRLFNGSDEAQEVRCLALDRLSPVKVDLRHWEIGPAERPLILSPWQFVTLRLF
jgi:glycosyl hydrolase family 38